MDDSPDDDIPPQFDEPRLSLDPACPTCHGTGVMEDGGRFLECICLLRQRVLHYLTPRYGSAIEWNPEFCPAPYQDKDVLLENTHALPESAYRALAFAVVKSFLLVTGQRFSHRTLTPYDIIQLYLDNLKAPGFDDLAKRVDVLIILFGIDPPNRGYTSVLPWLLRRRRELGLVSWILSGVPLDSKDFNTNYPGLGDPLTRIADGFVTLPVQPAHARTRP